MKKKSFIFLLILLFSFGLVACQTTSATTTTTTTSSSTTTTTTTTSQTTQSTTAFVITLAGLGDAGYTDEDKIYTGEQFDLMAGVTAFATDGVDYAANTSVDTDNDACTITGNMLVSNSVGTCVVTYTVVVGTKYDRANRNIKISAAPVVMEFTETDLFDNDAVFGTDYTVNVVTNSATVDPGVNNFYGWQEASAVLGTTGSVVVSGGKLIINQETMGSVAHALQIMALTEVGLNKGQYYKITLTITSDVARVIDIVTKAPNSDWANDTHSLIEVAAGTAEYEMVFKANQTTLHLNIMTGAVEGNMNAGTLEFSNFTLWEGPIVYEYAEMADFFTNSDVAVDTEIEFIHGTTTDADYVRAFYYWDNGQGAMMSGTVTADGIDVTVLTEPSFDYDIQLQWNDIDKAGTPLIVGSHYKLVMHINSPVAKTINLAVTGKVNALASSGSKAFDLKVGDNLIEMEFASLYDYFFMKVMFGNYGDMVNLGTYSITDLQLWQEVGFVPEEPIDTTVPVGNVFGEVANVNGDIAINPETAPVGEFYVWKGIVDWFAAWTAFPELTGTYTDGEVALDITNEGAPEFWGIQLLYAGGDIVNGQDYMFAFVVESDVARSISVQIKDGGAYVDETVDLVVGINYVEINFTAEAAKFNLQINLGNFDSEADESGLLVFSQFVLSRPTQLVEGFFANGDFAEDAALAATDQVGWAFWSTTGVDWLGETEPEYLGTTTIAGGVMTAVTTQTGHQQWACQIQYNHDAATMTVGALYKVEFDVNADIATHIVAQLKTEGDAANQDVPVQLSAGDNHVVVYFVAQQTTFRMFLLLGLTDPSTLIFDNFQLSEPIVPAEEPEPIEYIESATPILNGDFDAVGFAVNGEGSSWASWTTIGEGSWTTPVDANISVVDGKVVVETLGVGDYVWSIQLQYRPVAGGVADVVAGNKYKVEFDVNASVAGTFSMEMSTTDNAGNIAIAVTLVEGDNHVVVEYVAFESHFMLTASLGQYGAATLTFDNFVLYEEAQYAFYPVQGGIIDGDFTNTVTLNAEGSSWASWTTINEGSWTTPVDATFTQTDGAYVVETLGTGDYVWSIQFQYRPALGAMDVIPGDLYKLEFDVNATVAGTFSMEMTTTGNAANIAIPVVLEVGANHIVLEYTAYEPQFMLTASIGQYGAAILTFDNFKLSHEILTNGKVEYVLADNQIDNGDFTDTVTMNAEGSPWTSWTTVNEGSWTTAVDATFVQTDGAMVVTTLGTGDYVWSIQFGYRPALGELNVVPGEHYRVEFDVNASVAGTFSMELTTSGNVANVAIPVTLVEGDNHVVVHYIAWEPQLMLTACIGQYGAAVLTFDNFTLYEEAVYDFVAVSGGIIDGDFTNIVTINAEGSNWTSWTTIGEGSWTTAVDATYTQTDGTMVITTLGTGDYVWSIQFGYRPALGAMDVVPGDVYRVEFDVTATVAGTFSMEMTTTGNAANIAIPVTLVEGLNHIVVEYTAYEAQLMLTACLGQYGAATLTFDNFELSHLELINGPIVG